MRNVRLPSLHSPPNPLIPQKRAESIGHHLLHKSKNSGALSYCEWLWGKDLLVLQCVFASVYLRGYGYLRYTFVVCFLLCSSLRLSVSYFSIWFPLIPFSSSNPLSSPSSSHSSSALFPSCSTLPPTPPPLSIGAGSIAALRGGAASFTQFWFIWQPLHINTLWRTDAWMPVRGNRNVDDASWRGWTLPWHRQTLLARWSRVIGHCWSNAPARRVLPRNGPQQRVTVEPEKIST